MKIIVTESQMMKLQFEQYADASQLRAPSDYLGKGGQFERESPLFDPNKILLRKGPKKGTSLDETMESFRESLFTSGGMAIEAFLTAFAFTAPLVVGAYAGLLSYDIYKSLNGETDWFNIICDTLGVVTSGAVAGLFAPLMRGGKKAFTSITKVFEWLKTTSIWKRLQPFLSVVVSGLSTVGGWIGKGLKWVADNTGLTFLYKLSSKIVSFFSSITNQILESIGNVPGKATTAITGSDKVGQASAKAIKVGVGNEVIMRGLESETGHKIVNKILGRKEITGQEFQNIKPTDADYKIASQINFK